MHRVFMAIMFAAGLAISEVGFADSQHEFLASPTTDVVERRIALRDLWLGHIFWVREVVSAVVTKDVEAMEVAEGRVVNNAKQIAEAIEPFYGRAAADQLFKLLAAHYSAIKAHASAVVSGDAAEAGEITGQLAANAKQLSQFLSAANPHLPQQTLQALLTAHAGHHLQQNEQFAKGEREAEARTWDAMRTHIFAISDALSAALAKQFPVANR